jgi:hypothetical protein
MQVVDLTGMTFGDLTVLRRHDENTSYRAAQWVCRCSCDGREIIISAKNLQSGTKSCGHRRVTEVRKANIRHGGRLTPEYTAYASAKNRCTNPKNTAFDRYGERGIKFKFTDFEHFLSVLGPRPEGHSLDRIDVDGNYEPGNVRWATSKQQARNRRCDNCAALKARITELEAQVACSSMAESSAVNRVVEGSSPSVPAIDF